MSQELPSLSPADIIAASGHIGYMWDLTTDHIMWCGSWSDLLGPGCEPPPGNAKELGQVVVPSDHHLIFNDTAPTFDREYRLKKPDGTAVYVHEHGTTDFVNGRAVRQQGLLRRIVAPSYIGYGAGASPDRDPLTGRPNRTCMMALIEKIIKDRPELRNNSAYLTVGIDKLAFVNEAMGTKAGDFMLCAVADRLNDIIPTRAIIGRVGGDVFGVLLPGLAQETDIIAERILKNFHNQAVFTGSSSLHVSVCIGRVNFSETGPDAATIIINADQALTEARMMGPGKQVAYVKSTDRTEMNRAILETGEKVKEALRTDTLKLAFQPVFDAKTNVVQFYEALSRLFNDDGRLIPPGDFIPVVEMLGLAPDFDRHVLKMAIRELETCDTLRLAVNISGMTAALPDWPAFVHDQLAGKPQVARRLIIEITENAAVLDIAKIKCLVDSLRELGSEVALDDFGAGTTSIRHLRDLSLTIMKIDRELLDNLLTSPEQQHLVRMLTSMAHGLGLRAVAEGIETAEVAEWLRCEGVDMLQGFYLARPSFDRPWLAPEQNAQDGTAVSSGVFA